VLIGVFVTAFLFSFATVFVALGTDYGPALVRSKDLAVAHTGETALLIAVIVGVNLAGALLCGLGLLVSVPVSLLILLEGLDQLEPGAAG